MSFALVAQFRSLDDTRSQVQRLLLDYRAKVREEPGNILFEVNALQGDPGQFLVYEEYDDEGAFNAHLSSSHNLAFNDSLAALVVGGVSDLTILVPLQGGNVETH